MDHHLPVAPNGYWQDPPLASPQTWPYASAPGPNAIYPSNPYPLSPVHAAHAMPGVFHPFGHQSRFTDPHSPLQSVPSYYMGHDPRTLSSTQAQQAHQAAMLHKQHVYNPAANNQSGHLNGMVPTAPNHHGYVHRQGPRYGMHTQVQPLDMNRMPTAPNAANQHHSPISPPHFQSPHVAIPPSPQAPRGPPRKPKRSGHAIWVGNIPMGASIEALKDHFSRDATMDIESVFLMAKSNCAFVNYVTEEACFAAVERFNHSLFGSVRLLCRIRRDASSNREGSQSSASMRQSPMTTDSTVSSAASSNDKLDEVSDAVAGLGISHEDDTSTPDTSPLSQQQPVLAKTKPDERYFVLKSLTKEDLQESLMKGTWETQAHNQQILHDAFYEASNVYLIFSVNKSGEYFGYARMISSPMDRSSQQSDNPFQDSTSNKTQNMKRTPATATAPRGHIIDDPPRGILFWEAEHDNRAGIVTSDGTRPPDDGTSSQQRSRPFQIEWLSVRRVTFQKTKGMRNTWNSNKEVKVARDGTELETEVGRGVVGLFHEGKSGGP
ncbi:hypothetical protein M409DRAFT_55109 [Zasmidium cellare ATCC 36951]|uniref:YTH domain-containing protein n=1 Tax=Zasmidium cellare ATCC 36951 TaxID=1080233 RepID=A0A6A6CJ72_ZASCE|nr:uncharacterized protein M409DRAFT_55109 [Zasmidium cellare ATCC 36951]KAF2166250.1 hypothetical protein M409DRAFT_55109 [Zasmidium cellare ATCC 36951]